MRWAKTSEEIAVEISVTREDFRDSRGDFSSTGWRAQPTGYKCCKFELYTHIQLWKETYTYLSSYWLQTGVGWELWPVLRTDFEYTQVYIMIFLCVHNFPNENVNRSNVHCNFNLVPTCFSCFVLQYMQLKFTDVHALCLFQYGHPSSRLWSFLDPTECGPHPYSFLYYSCSTCNHTYSCPGWTYDLC